MVGVIAVMLYFTAATTPDPLYGAINTETQVLDTEQAAQGENSLVLWYTDDSLTEYLTTAALLYQKERGAKVEPRLVSGVNYLEEINRVSAIEEDNPAEPMPDLYLTTHDNLLRAHLSNLAAEVIDKDGILTVDSYPATALHAVTCYNRNVGYPLYYETNYFLYNKTYMASIAQNKMEKEADLQMAEEAQEELEENGPPEDEIKKQDAEEKAREEAAKEEADGEDASKDEAGKEATDNEEAEASDGSIPVEGGIPVENAEEETPMGEEDVDASNEVLERLSTMIPSTIDDITTFANNYDAPEAVESVFEWDVSDIFYNYFFIGNYAEVGGEDGDNAAIFNIYNQQAVDCLTVYQNMNQFFSIDAKNVSYDSILDDFIKGKTVFTVATTDAIARIEAAKANGDFEFDYGVTTLPDISSLLKARGLSVTTCLAINGYSAKQELANDFASYLCETKSADLYKKTGKVACHKGCEGGNAEIGHIMEEYEKSMPLPKMVEASNYWVQLEIAFTKVWQGEDPDETLKSLAGTMQAQIDEIRANLPTQESFSAGAGSFIK